MVTYLTKRKHILEHYPFSNFQFIWIHFSETILNFESIIYQSGVNPSEYDIKIQISYRFPQQHVICQLTNIFCSSLYIFQVTKQWTEATEVDCFTHNLKWLLLATKNMGYYLVSSKLYTKLHNPRISDWNGVKNWLSINIFSRLERGISTCSEWGHTREDWQQNFLSTFSR